VKKKLSKNKTKIMIFGTFDGLHKGHLNLFKQARKLAKESFLTVSIARDVNVKKIKGGLPCLDEKERAFLIKKCKLVDKVILSGIKNHTAYIIRENPDIIALGYDQKVYVDDLKKDFKNKGLKVKIVRLKPYKEEIYKNHLLKNKS
jgi:FAD synthetase